MKKRPISAGRRPVNGDAGGGAQTDRPTPSFEEVVLSMQVRLQGLEQKYASFVSRCLAVLKERKALLTARISGEGGVVDETFRVEMSELSREKDCIEEDIRYMLELKRGSKRKEAGLMDLIKAVDRTCGQSQEQVSALVPPELQIAASEAFQSLQRSLQAALIDFNNGKAQHFQEISQLVKQLQADNSALQAQLREIDKSEALMQQMRQEKLDLQDKIRSLQSQTPTGSSESPSFSHRDDSLDSPHFPTTDRLRADSSPLRTDSDMSRLKRKLIATTKERDLLRVWKQNHVSMPPPALALMQQLRTELANCTEKHQTLKTYFSDKLKGLTSAASTFLTVSERAVYRRDASVMGIWEQCRAALLSALQSNSTQPKDFDLSSTRHVGVQTASEEAGRTGEDTDRRKLLGRLKALEEAVRAEQSEVSKLAKMKAEHESQNGKLTLTVTELRRTVDQLTTEKTRWQQGLDRADLEARVKDLEKDRKLVIDRWQSEKIAKDRLREECNRVRMREEEVGQKLSKVAEVAESQVLQLQGVLEPVQAYLQRIAAASRAVRALQGHSAAQLRKERQRQDTQLASFRELQARNSTAGKEAAALRAAREALQAEVKERDRAVEVAREKIATLQRKLAEVSSLNEELEEALRREKEVSSDLLAELQKAKSLPPDPVNPSQARELSILKKELGTVTADRDALASKLQQSDQLEGQLGTLRLEVEAERRKWEKTVAGLEGEIVVLLGNEKRTRLEAEQMQREIQAKSEHFEEEKMDLESYINAQNQNLREAEADLEAVSEERRRLEAQFQAISSLMSTQWSKFTQSDCLQDNVSNLLQELQTATQSHTSTKASLEGLIRTLQVLIGAPQEAEGTTISALLEGTVTSVKAWASSLKADLENLRLSKDHLTELFLRLDEENENLGLQVERTVAEMEDLRSCCRREQSRKSSDGQFKWTQEREILFQGFNREKSELKAAYEQDVASLRAQIVHPTVSKLPIAAEDVESDFEIQLIEGEELAIEVAAEPEVTSAPSQGCEALFQALCEKAAAEQRDLREIMQHLGTGCEFKQTQTSFKYGDPSYLSMEEDISAVEGALRPDAGSEDHTVSRLYGKAKQ